MNVVQLLVYSWVRDFCVENYKCLPKGQYVNVCLLTIRFPLLHPHVDRKTGVFFRFSKAESVYGVTKEFGKGKSSPPTGVESVRRKGN